MLQYQEQDALGHEHEHNGWTTIGRHERKDTWANEGWTIHAGLKNVVPVQERR